MRNAATGPRQVPPKHWTRSVQSALIHVIALAQYALVCSRSQAGNSSRQRARLAAKADQLEEEIVLLREEGRIKYARMGRIPASKRPHYLPTERLAILELRAAPRLVVGPNQQGLPGDHEHHRFVDQSPR